MECRWIFSQLNALADGETGPLQSWRIRRHLRRCAVCAEELARIQQIGVLAREWGAAEAPSTLEARVFQALGRLPAGEAVLPHSTKETPIMQNSNPSTLPVQPNITPLSRLTPARLPFSALRVSGRVWRPVAALSVAGIALGLLAISLIPTHKTLAFAAVVQAMERVKTIHWVVQSNGFTQPGASLESQTAMVRMETWARLDKLGYATLITPDGSGRTMIAAGKLLTILDNKVVTEMAMPDFAGKDPEQGLRAYILSQVMSSFKATAGGADPGVAPDGSGIKSEETVLNGQPVIRFYGGSNNGVWKFELSVWVDPKTNLVVRSESVMTNPVAGQADLHMIADQFRYNEEPPAGIFDVPPTQDAGGVNGRILRIAPAAPPQVAPPRLVVPRATAPKVEAFPGAADRH